MAYFCSSVVGARLVLPSGKEVTFTDGTAEVADGDDAAYVRTVCVQVGSFITETATRELSPSPQTAFDAVAASMQKEAEPELDKLSEVARLKESVAKAA